MFATKADLLPKHYTQALSCVLDNCAPMQISKVRQIVESELNAPLCELFLHFDENPIGSATIAQVHEAITLDGRRVAVKVQNVRNKKLMRFDLNNMLFVSRFLDRLHIFLPFDHTSILVEYSSQVSFCESHGRSAYQYHATGASGIRFHKGETYAECTGRVNSRKLQKSSHSNAH